MSASASATVRYGMSITTVDPTQGLIRGVMKGDAQERSILVMEIPNAFRWPRVGESWMVAQKNGTWYLEGFIPSLDGPAPIDEVNAGDLVLTTPTGIVHVIGSADGSTDFTLSQALIPTRKPRLSFNGNLQIALTHAGHTGNVNLVTF